MRRKEGDNHGPHDIYDNLFFANYDGDGAADQGGHERISAHIGRGEEEKGAEYQMQGPDSSLQK